MIRHAKLLLSLSLLVAFCGTARSTEKPFEPMTPYFPSTLSPAGLNCYVGPTTLCVPLDATFTTVDFASAACSGASNPADPCQRNDDDYSVLVPLPFTFTLYGTAYTSCYINNNGNISFGAGYCTFTSTGFPVSGFPMVAPFWADVDTRNGSSGVAHYKVEPHRLTVVWDHVGYYLGRAELVNTFELIISDGTDPTVGIGNNVCLCFDDMQWTTGQASGGGPFGGTPATVGVNAGNGIDFVQIGRFDHPGTDYDGPGGVADGVSYLDGRHICLNASGQNIPPVPQGFPSGNATSVCPGQTLTLNTSFISPELAQTTTTSVELFGLANASASSVPGNPSTQTLTFTPDNSQTGGTYSVRYTAVDDGVPPEMKVVDLTINVSVPPVCAIEGPDRVCPGESIRLCGPAGNFDYLWSTNETGQCIDVGSPGTYALRLTDRDTGCSSTCSRDIVICNLPPRCDNAAASTPVLWPPNHTYRPVTITGVTDPDGDPVTITITGVRQDEPLNTRGDGNTCPDAQISGEQASLRAERSGTPGLPGNGRVYSISFTAADGRGGSCTGTVYVCVPHDTDHPTCVDDGQRFDSTGPCGGEDNLVPEVTDVALNVAQASEGEVRIEFALPADTDVRVAVFDVSGRQVAVVENSRLGAGIFQRSWNTRGVAKGMYFVRMKAGNQTLTKTVLKTR